MNTYPGLLREYLDILKEVNEKFLQEKSCYGTPTILMNLEDILQEAFLVFIERNQDNLNGIKKQIPKIEFLLSYIKRRYKKELLKKKSWGRNELKLILRRAINQGLLEYINKTKFI